MQACHLISISNIVWQALSLFFINSTQKVYKLNCVANIHNENLIITNTKLLPQLFLN